MCHCLLLFYLASHEKGCLFIQEIQARISCAIAQADWRFYLSSATMASGSIASFYVFAQLCVLRGQNVEDWISHDVAYIMFARLLFVCLYYRCIILYR